MTLATIVGKRIAKARDEANLSGTELADLLEIARQTLCNWEKGRKTPTIPSIIKLSKTLNVSIEYLLGIRDEPTGNGSKKIPLLDMDNVLEHFDKLSLV